MICVGAVARPHVQLVVLRQPGDLEHRQPVLARAEHLAGPAQLRGRSRRAGSRRARSRSPRAAAAPGRRTGRRATSARRGPRARAAGAAATGRSARRPRSASRSRSARRCPPRSRSWPPARRPRRRRTSPWPPPSASTASARGSAPRAGRANSVVRSRSNSAVAALAWSASDSSTSGQTTKHCRPAAISSRIRSYARARARAPSTTCVSTGRRPRGSSRSTVASRSPYAVSESVRGIGVAVMWSACGREPVGRLGVERGALAHAEAVLLVHHDHGEVAELHRVLDQRVRAHHQLELLRSRAGRAARAGAPRSWSR